MKKFVFSLLIIFSFTLSCKKPGDRKCFKSIGKIIRISRTVPSFKFINLEDKVNLIITQDTVNKIELEGGENILSFVKTEVENNTLNIRNDNRCDWLRSYKSEINVYVSIVKIDSIAFSGSGNITSTNTIRSDKFVVDLFSAGGNVDISVSADYARFDIQSGPGDIKVSGNSKECYFYSMGYGYIRAENLTADFVHVRQFGTGDFYVNAPKDFSVEIYESGSVFYSGNPVISKQILEGKGKLVHL